MFAGVAPYNYFLSQVLIGTRRNPDATTALGMVTDLDARRYARAGRFVATALRQIIDPVSTEDGTPSRDQRGHRVSV